MDQTKITLGVPKGRIMKDAAHLFAESGIQIRTNTFDDRSMVIPTSEPNLQFCNVRSKDIPMLLQAGVLDIGIIGSDVLMESKFDQYSAKQDLGISNCRLSVIARPETDLISAHQSCPRVATKYPELTKRYFEKLGMSPEIIKMNGSVEMAVVAGLTPFAVDVVSSGRTIKHNGLVELTVLMEASAHALVNNSSDDQRRERCNAILDQLIGSSPSSTSTTELPSEKYIEVKHGVSQ